MRAESTEPVGAPVEGGAIGFASGGFGGERLGISRRALI
ncbi:hypothetical protein DB32_008667 [Sandaracinus amylolyticus]|uniref:Uncharacterized protein n=1 Tax=Sandaracinus amylolyticus TaxID=927083 RepID=A0A0F6WAE2_9BACT|nr:hypothetical protein DB32_008667 [Sandaracinus amylolyticus]